MGKLTRFTLLGLLSSLFSVQAEVIYLPAKQEGKLANVLIEKAIDSNPDYSYVYPDNDTFVTMARQQAKVESGEYHLLWTLTSKDLEEKIEPIRIPIYKGLFGLRVGIVKQENINLFRNVRTLRDLQQFKAGQGTFWADTFILEANGLPVVKELKYPNLFPMTEGGRFDYFPRGIHEPWSEVVREKKYNLAVDPYVLIKYRAPFYYFVSPEYPEFRRFLQQKLEEMVADGTHQQLFMQDPQVNQSLEKGNIQNRVVIELANPTLHPDTPLDVEEYWFDPMEYAKTH